MRFGWVPPQPETGYTPADTLYPDTRAAGTIEAMKANSTIQLEVLVEWKMDEWSKIIRPLGLRMNLDGRKLKALQL